LDCFVGIDPVDLYANLRNLINDPGCGENGKRLTHWRARHPDVVLCDFSFGRPLTERKITPQDHLADLCVGVCSQTHGEAS
jgi:hypothetical protein